MTADDKARRTGKDICDQHCVIGYYTRDGSRALEADIDAALEAVRAEAREKAADACIKIANEYAGAARRTPNNGQMQDWERVAKRCETAVRAALGASEGPGK